MLKAKCSCGRIFELTDFSKDAMVAARDMQILIRHLNSNPEHKVQGCKA